MSDGYDDGRMWPALRRRTTSDPGGAIRAAKICVTLGGGYYGATWIDEHYERVTMTYLTRDEASQECAAKGYTVLP